MWLCIFMLRGQLATIHACACDYAYPWYAPSSQLWMHEHVNMHIYDEQTACDYACMCMWLCTSMLCSQLVTMYARAWVMQLYAMHSSCDYACLCMWLCTSMSCSQLVTSHAWACGYACMCMWLCTSTARSQTITLQELELCTFMPCSKFVTMHACGCDYAHLCHVVRL